MSRVDFAALFREFTIKQKEIKFNGKVLSFDGVEYDGGTETNFRGQNGVAYKLQDVWFMLAHREKAWLNYVKECNQYRFAIVSFMDHKDMLAYIKGTSETSTRITEPVLVGAPPAAAPPPPFSAAN